MSAELPLPVTVLSGFLGSGKTTLLNALLAAPHGRRLAVVVNEFGAIGVDGALVAGGEQFVQLDNGCLCCVLNEDLTQTMVDLQQRGGFEQVIIETTGLADPLPVARTFNRPQLSKAYRVDAVVTVVDAPHVALVLPSVPEACQQIAHADVLIINKIDLTADAGAAADKLLLQHNRLAPRFACTRGVGLPWPLLLQHASLPAAVGAATPAPAGLHTHHTPTFESFSFASAQPFDELQLEDLLGALPAGVYRLKGIVRTNAPWNWTLLNAVAGRMEMRPFTGDLTRVRPGLVFMGAQLDVAKLRQVCQQALCTTPPAAA